MVRPQLTLTLSLLLSPSLLACTADPGTSETQTQTETTLPGTNEEGSGCYPDQSACGSDCCDVHEACVAGSCVSDDGESNSGTETETETETDTETDTDTGGLEPVECAAPDPAWIFCDDFESDDPLMGEGRYFEVGDDEGDFAVVEGVGLGGSQGVRTHFETGEVDAGGLKLGFGRNPNAYMNTGVRSGEDFGEIWYRMYLRNGAGWTGDPAKLSRATIFTSADDWSQAMIAHLWGDGNERLLLDPVSCIVDGQVVCQGYNDFANMKWLGNLSGETAIFSTGQADQWFCVEAHVRLNDPGMSNGVQEFWIDGELEARREGLDFVGTWAEYGINAVFFENYWNDGSVQDQVRDWDNIVISTAPIGCL